MFGWQADQRTVMVDLIANLRTLKGTQEISETAML